MCTLKKKENVIIDRKDYILQLFLWNSIRFIGNGHLLINYSHSPWGSWASDNGAFSQPPFPPPLIITLGPIPSLFISLVVSGFSSFWFCVLAGDSDLCCSALATGIFITRNPLYVFLVFSNFVHNRHFKIRTTVLLHHLTTFTNWKKKHNEKRTSYSFFPSHFILLTYATVNQIVLTSNPFRTQLRLRIAQSHHAWF